MSCINCFDGCGTPMPDTCVKYTGENIPLLGISTGDPVSKVEQSIIAKLEEFAAGQGITLSTIDLKCDFLDTLFGCCKDKTLVNLIQLLIDANCTLKDLVASLEAVVFAPTAFNTSCLTGLPTNPTRDEILQATLDQLCSITTTVNTVAGDYVKATDLNSLIAAYLAGASGTVQQYTKMVPYVAYEYYGTLGNFDAGGKGIAAVGYDKVYICNGSNGTPDKRGRVAVGAVQGVPAGTVPLDPFVDPTIPSNAGTNYSLLQKFGQSYVTLLANQMPGHTHIATVSDLGHTHFTAGVSENGDTNDLVNSTHPVAYIAREQGEFKYRLLNSYTSATVGLSSKASSNITITNASSGGSQSHDNRQPSIAAYYIMYIP